MKVRFTPTAALLIVCFSTTALGQAAFTRHNISTDFDGAAGIVAIDFDRDGDIDVVGVAEYAPRVGWWENDGNENFEFHLINDRLRSPWGVAVADFDNDRDNDILVSDCFEMMIGLFETVEDGFRFHLLFEDALDWTTLTTGDYDGDGDIDFACAVYSRDKVAVWRNEGNLEFTEHVIDNQIPFPQSISSGDLDRDGDIDLGIAARGINHPVWYENRRNMNFTRRTLGIETRTPMGVEVGDLDGDGDADMVTSGYFVPLIVENLGEGRFATHSTPAIPNQGGQQMLSFAIADLTGDTLPELVSGQETGFSGGLYWYENLANWNYRRYDLPNDVQGSRNVQAKDVDGDGDVDILASSYRDDAVVWWENRLSSRPARFVMFNPDSGFVSSTTDVEFNWDPAVEADSADSVTYELYVWPHRGFLGQPTARGLVRTDFVVDLLDDSTYWWTVHATDLNTDGRWADQVWSFSINQIDPPRPFNLLDPPDMTRLELTPITFVWEPTTDPDPGDRVHYLLQIATNPRFENPIEIDVGTVTRMTLWALEFSDIYWWRVAAIDTHGRIRYSIQDWTFRYPDPAGVRKASVSPSQFEIVSIYPQPFNSSTMIEFSLPRESRASLCVFDIAGREVVNLLEGIQPAGKHTIVWSANHLPAGTYLILFESGDFRQSQRVVILR